MAKAKRAPSEILPIGATHFPAKGNADPQPLPAGITIRSKRSVQIEFMWQGRRSTESLPGAPDVEAVARAVTKRQSVVDEIALGVFDYARHFPNSRKVRRAEERQARAEAATSCTMGELLEEWLQRYALDNPHNRNTLDTHKEVVASRLAPSLGFLAPKDITVDKYVQYRASLRAEGLSDSRISNILTPLRGALSMAVERGLIASSPAHSSAPTKQRRSKKVELNDRGEPSFSEPLPTTLDPAYQHAAKSADPLNDSERASVLAKLVGQVRNLFLFAFWSGLRTGELIALRWCDVSADRKRILVRLSYSKRHFTTTKGRRARWVDLTPPAVAALNAQWALTGDAGRWVFNNPRTRQRWQNSQRLRVHWIRALEAAGVRYRKPYQTRHTYASLMVSAGESPEWVAEQMGHLDGRLVAHVYGRWMAPGKAVPGQAAAAVYQQEWAAAEGLVARVDEVELAEVGEREVEAGGPEEDDEEDF
ncbi:tyrosine-type recombinase/integrase [Ramlibacter sp. G-1-2-2]|uniref:Tyrosine-type recombinase/integrase n=1 Tax=Ramlibacter agri TaxID=2728837 RepID=A0A848H4J0_9BURK|nr:tyrosine-type recombinase/integrase [Ramlibacter agri]NML45906.1 tyrosine-type recombinase/integrase [Ramlibacter agri]